MSWNQDNGNGQQRPMKMPDLGKGWLRPPKGNRTEKSPNFKGLVNFEGQIMDLAIWFHPAKAGANGQMMPETFSVNVKRFDPNVGQQAPQQQQMQYAPPPPQQAYAPPLPVYAQPAPGPAYAPSPQPPQHGGYAPAPGYQPPPPAPQQPAWGGQPAQARPPQSQAAQAGAGYKPSEVPFMREDR